MKIYTKTGDKGETSLFGGKRVPKDTLRIEVYGTVDELNSAIGICRAINKRKIIERVLKQIQNDLFKLGADLASALSVSKKYEMRIQRTDIVQLEKQIDHFNSYLKPLKYFIIPGGNHLSSLLHFTRSVCRRAERLTVKLMRKEKLGEFPIIYLNRLSDLLFILARWVNHTAKIKEEKWLRK